MSVLVGIDPEVAELAPLAAEGNVQVQAQRHILRRRMQGGFDFRQRLLAPLREGRIVGDEITADFGFGGFGGHYQWLLEADYFFSPKQYTTPRSVAITSFPSATAGEPVMPPESCCCHSSLPSARSMA